MAEEDLVALYVEKLLAMFGDLGSPEFLLLAALQHDTVALWASARGRAGQARGWAAAADELRRRANRELVARAVRSRS